MMTTNTNQDNLGAAKEALAAAGRNEVDAIQLLRDYRGLTLREAHRAVIFWTRGEARDEP